MRRVLATVLLAFCAALAAPAAPARAWPDRPVAVVVPFGPGSAPDVIARLLGERLGAAWGRPVVVQNLPGAGGSVGVDRVAKAAPDGHTLVLSGDAAVVTRPSMSPLLSYDPVRDLAPVTLVARTTNVLVVAPSVPAATLAELVALARARPGQLTYGHVGPGTSLHVAGEMLRQMAGIDITGVSYANPAQMVQDVLEGRVTMMFSNSIAALPRVRAGQLRALAVASAARVAEAPDVPTVSEQGYPGFEVVNWFGLLAPARTPPEVVAQVHRDVAAALAEPELRARLSGLGAEVVASTPAEFAGLIEREIPRMRAVVRASGARAE